MRIFVTRSFLVGRRRLRISVAGLVSAVFMLLLSRKLPVVHLRFFDPHVISFLNGCIQVGLSGRAFCETWVLKSSPAKFFCICTLTHCQFVDKGSRYVLNEVGSGSLLGSSFSLTGSAGSYTWSSRNIGNSQPSPLFVGRWRLTIQTWL